MIINKFEKVKFIPKIWWFKGAASNKAYLALRWLKIGIIFQDISKNK